MSESSTEILDARTASALFLNMIVQQTNMTLIFLGKTPNPETGQLMQDLQTAKILIDQLEMLAIKTKGNLTPQESALMNQSLAAVRMSFVEAVEHEPKISPEATTKDATEKAPAPGSAASRPAQTQAQEEPKPAEPPSASPAPEDSESRKKFSKKY